MAENQSFDAFAIVDLFGHTKIAGRVSEQVIAGAGFIRIDVPALPADQYHLEEPAFTALYGAAAIFSIVPVSEEIAMRVAQAIRIRPINAYITHPQLGVGDDEDEETDV